MKEIELSSVQDLAHTLFIKHHSILPSVPDVAAAIKIFLTLPITFASTKDPSQNLKSYLRSTMAQERLSELIILCIENKHARSLDLKKVVWDFAHQYAKISQHVSSTASL